MQKIIVDDNHIPIEKYICKKLNIPYILVCKLMRLKKIKLKREGKTINISEKLELNDEIIIYASVESSCLNKKVIDNQLEIREKLLLNNKIYEDDNVLIINKPRGLAVQSGTGIKISIDELLVDNEGIVHRIDEQTSGVLMISKNITTNRILQQKFKDRTMNKIYLGVLDGVLHHNKIVNAPIMKDGEYMIIDRLGKEAISTFYPITSKDNYTLCIIKPVTGRTHQIRLHAHHINKPIVGDYKYHTRNKRMFLHALSIEYNNTLHTASLDKLFMEVMDFFNISITHLMDFVNKLN